MGTRCAPNFANLFMASLEEEFLQTERKQGRPQPSIWLRYVDDIILIWEHYEQTLKDFVQRLNGFDNNINFILDFSYNSIDFLDIKIYKGKKFSNQGLLDFQPYRKTCHKNSYLSYDSCHSANTFKSIVRGEAMRLLKNSIPFLRHWHFTQPHGKLVSVLPTERISTQTSSGMDERCTVFEQRHLDAHKNKKTFKSDGRRYLL